MTTDNQKIHALLVDEEMARAELSKNIESLLKRTDDPRGYTETIEQVFLAFQDYMVGVKELSDILRGTICPSCNSPSGSNQDNCPTCVIQSWNMKDNVHTRDTEPHHMPFDLEKAPDTKRCT